MRLIDADRLANLLENDLQLSEEMVSEHGKGVAHGTRIALNRIADQPTISQENPQPQWIPVKDRLPEEKQRVLVRCKTVGTTVGWRLWGEWMTDLGDGGSEVTNWLPLPEPYTAKVEDDDNARRVKPLEFDRFKNDTLKDAQPTAPAHWEKADIPLPYQVRTVPTPSGTFAHREMYVCSACDGYNDKNTQYCPHCGAKMDKEVNDDD